MSENISSNNIYQTQIPSLTDAADIQDAFKLYHFGSSTEPASASVSDGIAGHLYDLDTLKAPIAGPTFTGTLTAPTINASTALQIGGVAITSTAAELNILDGVTASTAELNILDGVTSSTAELNTLDGVTSTAAELNLVDGSVAGTIVNSKAVVYGSLGQVNATTLQIGGTSITSTAAELNLVDGSVAGTVVNNKAVIYNGTGDIVTNKINGLTLTSATTGFTVAGGTTSKTLTVSNTITLAGTDSSTLNIGTGGTLGSNAFTSTSYQPLATNLTSIGNLANSAGYLYNNGSGTFSYATPADINTTYSQSAVTTTGGALLRLTSSGAVNDDVKFASSGSTTVSYTDASTITISSTDNNFYPTAVTMTGGSTSGPVVGLTMNSGSVTTATIPSASNSASGIVTTGEQTFAGTKNFSQVYASSLLSSGASIAATTFITAGSYISASGNITSSLTVNGQTVSSTGNMSSGGSLTRTLLNDGTTTTATFNSTGNLVRTTSSARYKDEITPANFTYEDVLSLEPKTFKLKHDIEHFGDGRVYAGFIAEDVDQINSLKVFVNYMTQEDGSKIPDGINYGEMVSALVSAIKHQDSIIQSLTARIEALEA